MNQVNLQTDEQSPKRLHFTGYSEVPEMEIILTVLLLHVHLAFNSTAVDRLSPHMY